MLITVEQANFNAFFTGMQLISDSQNCSKSIHNHFTIFRHAAGLTELVTLSKIKHLSTPDVSQIGRNDTYLITRDYDTTNDRIRYHNEMIMN